LFLAGFQTTLVVFGDISEGGDVRQLEDESVALYEGDCLQVLRCLPDASVHCCVTSPPYFGLRDYSMDAQIGLEETPDEYVAKLVAVFREVHRVLRDDGTLWVNLGDSYASSGGSGIQGRSGERADRRHTQTSLKYSAARFGLKPKDLIGIPWRLAFALQADGWYLRQDIIWHKPNAMPESVKDRCTKAHEYIFLLSKSPTYFFDYEAFKEPSSQPNRIRRDRFGGNKYQTGIMHSDGSIFTGSATRNRRSVWSVSTKPFKGAHFATFPTDLIEPCVLAGSPRGGVVLDPFGGAGTTGLVARAHDRLAIMSELNPEYVDLAADRLGLAESKMAMAA
jgi:site-specific DNA-methyltransferase (adenine-specific)